MNRSYPMHLTRAVVLIISMFIVMASCKRTEKLNNETVVSDTTAAIDSLQTTDISSDDEFTDAPLEVHEVIDYINNWGMITDASNAFGPFEKLKAELIDFIHDKDSLKEIGGDALEIREKTAHAAIMDYKRSIESGKYLETPGVGLLDLARSLGEKDSTNSWLPKAQPSWFTNGNFFFLGGAPFIGQLIEYDTATQQQIIHKDAGGKPEVRFKVTYTENKYHLLKTIMQFRKPRVKIDFGGPVNNYDAPTDDVKGVGSIIHNFVDVSVFFIMENGVVPGQLKYFQTPFSQQFECYSDYPYLIVSCSTDIDPDKIVGIYIPYDDHVPATCSVTHPDKWSWSADLNNDNIPDIACVIGTYEGVESAVLEMLWFVNLNGIWKIVDYGAAPTCT